MEQAMKISEAMKPELMKLLEECIRLNFDTMKNFSRMPKTVDYKKYFIEQCADEIKSDNQLLQQIKNTNN